MPRLIDIGGYGTLSFDDGTSDEDIQSYVDDNYKEISNRLNIPPEPVGMSLSKLLPNAIERGYLNAKKAGNLLQLELGLDDVQNAVYDIRRYQQRQAEIPINKDDGETLEKITQAKTLGEAFDAFKENKSVLFPLIGESIGTYLPTIAVGGPAAFLTRGLLGRIVGALATGSGSGATEYGLSVIDAFNEAGVNINDGAELAEAFSDEEKLSEAREFAIKRGVPVGAFDALAFGTAGLLSNALKTGAKTSLSRKALTALGETAQAATLGSVGEATAQIQSEGRITSPGSVFLEGIAEGPIGIVEAGLATLKKDVNKEDDLSKPLQITYQPVKQIGTTVKQTARIEDKSTKPKQIGYQPKIGFEDKIKGEGFTVDKNTSETTTASRGIRSKIFNFVSDLATQGTKDGTNSRRLTPSRVLKVLGSAEKEFLKRNTDDNGFKFIEDSLEELVKINKLEKRGIYRGQDKVGTIYQTISPLDNKTLEKVKKFEQQQAQKKKAPKKKEKIKLTKPRLEFSGTATVEEFQQNTKPLDSSITTNVVNAIKDLPQGIANKAREYLLMSQADKVGKVKNIHAINKDNEVVGKVQEVRLTGIPGIAKNLYAGINVNNPDDTKLFEREDQAAEYINDKLKDETIDTQEDLSEINDFPNFSVEIDEQVEDVTIPEFAARESNKDKKAFTQKTKPENERRTTQDNKQRPINDFDSEELNDAREVVDAIEDESPDNNMAPPEGPPPPGEPPQPPSDDEPPGEQPRSETTIDANTIDRMRDAENSALDKAIAFFSGPLNGIAKLGSWFVSQNFLARNNKLLATHNYLLTKRTEKRAALLEKQSEILEPWTKLGSAESEKKVGIAAIFSKAYKTILRPNENGEIVITAEDFNRGAREAAERRNNPNYTDPLNVDGRGEPVGTKLTNFQTIDEDIVLDPIEVEAYLSLEKVQQFRRDLVIKQTLSQLKKELGTSEPLINQLNITDEQLSTPEGIQEVIDGLNELANLYRQVDPSVAQLVRDAAKRIAIMLKNSDTLYFPLSRRGDRFVAVTENVIKNGELKKETRYWTTYDTKDGKNKVNMNKLKNIESELIEQLDPNEDLRRPNGEIFLDENGNPVKRYVHSGIKLNNYNQMASSLGPSFYESLETFIEFVPTDIRNGNMDFLTMLRDRARTAAKVKGTPTFFREARLIPGYDFNNVVQSLNDSITSFATWDSHFEFETDIQEATAAIENDNSGETTDKQKEYTRALMNYLDKDPLEFQSVRQLAFLYFLTDISASVMNLFQAIPAMVYTGAYAGNRRTAAKQVKTMKDLIKLRKRLEGIPKFKNDNLIDLDKVIEKYGSRIPRLSSIDKILGSVIAPSRINEYLASDIGSVVRSSGLRTDAMLRPTQDTVIRKLGGRIGERTLRMAGSLFTTTEILNRLASYITSYELTENNNTLRKALNFSSRNENFNVAVERTLNTSIDNILDNFDTFIQNPDNREALRDIVARSAVEETQFVYGAQAKPRINRGAGALLFQFSEYPTMMMQLMYSLLRERGPEGKKAFGLYMLALIVTSGFMGLPFVEDGLELFERLVSFGSGKKMNIEKEYFELMDGIMSPEFADAFANGFLRLANLDIGPRVGLGSHPISAALLDGLTGEYGIDKASIPAVSVVRGFVDAVSYARVDDSHMALASILPKPLANIVKTIALDDRGYKTKRGELVIKRDEISNYAKFLQSLGFTPAEIAQKRELHYLQKSGKDPAAILRDRFYRRIQKAEGDMYRAKQDGDKGRYKRALGDLKDAEEDVREHNEKARAQGEYNLIIKIDPKTRRKRRANEVLGGDSITRKLPAAPRKAGRELERIYPSID